MYLTGSKALQCYFRDSFWRPIKDTDFFSSENNYKTFKDFHKKDLVLEKATKRGFTLHIVGYKPKEFEIIEPGTTGYEFFQIRNSLGNFDYALNPFEVGLFKMSHKFLKNSPHFKKTMDDIIMLKSKGWLHDTPYYYKDWLKKREKETYDYSHPNLNVKKNDFFRKDTGIDYIYDHDSIHQTVAISERPIYFSYLEDGQGVKTSKEKFLSLPLEKQLLGPLEESYVLALERHQIPNNFKPDRKKSFEIALMKVCTSVTSGWFRNFSYNHYYEVLQLYNENYVDKFQIGLHSGIVKPFTGTK